MERGRIRDHIPLATAASILAIAAGIGIADRGSGHPTRSTAISADRCLPLSDNLPPQELPDRMNGDQVLGQFRQIPLETSPDEYDALQSIGEYSFPGDFGTAPYDEIDFQPGLSYEQIEEDYGNALASMGVRVLLEPGAAADLRDEQYGAGPNKAIYQELAGMPTSIVAASGLHEVVITPSKPHYLEDPYREPEHYGGTLVLPASDVDTSVPDGLAGMILDNHCSQLDREMINAQFESITHQAGYAYDPKATYNYDLSDKPGSSGVVPETVARPGETLSGIAGEYDVPLGDLEALNRDIADPAYLQPGQVVRLGLGPSAAQREETDFQERFGDKAFAGYGYDTVIGPRLDFISLFADAIRGDTYRYDRYEVGTPVGQKRRVVQAVIDTILPNAQTYEKAYTWLSYYGSCGQQPDEVANRVQAILDKKPGAPGKDWCVDNVTYLNTEGYNY